MLDNINVRRLTKDDVNIFFNLRLESLQKSPASFLASYEEERNSGSVFFENLLNEADIQNVIFGAFVKEKLIGIIGVFQENMLKTAHKCKIWGMYVQSDYRNRGIGKLLLEIAIRHAKEKIKSSIINLNIETNSFYAKKLYESFGFKVWGTEIKAMRIDENFYDVFHMTLILK